MAPYDFKTVEPEILQFWEKHKILEKARKKNKNQDPFYWLEGPPYTSGKVHLGHAWIKALKGMVLRYKRMQGYDVWDRSGYDMHGLPTEHATMKVYNLKNKDDILKLGLEKFAAQCKKVSVDFMKSMNKDFVKEGIWMDFENAYQPIQPEYIEGVWWMVKTAHEKGRLYEGLRTIHWCPSCATAVAKHELTYKEITDNSIFIKLPVDKEKNTFLLVWTTTPWTTPLNLGVMANPEVDYVKAKVDNETWILAKALAAPVIQAVAEKEFKITSTFKGKELEGTKYTLPLYKEMENYYKEIESKSKKAFTVVMSKEHVDTTSGTGLVHMAPGCGPEDYDVGHKNGIPPLNPLDEQGYFPKDAGAFGGLRAKYEDNKFIELFEDSIIASTKVQHDYAHCERCKTAVVFRTTKQWFFKVEDLKKKIIAENKKIQWQPKAAFNAFNSWLENLRDNSITKQRFWGTPIPIWRCNHCNNYDVIGSREELKKLAGKLPKDLHKPYIDEITYKCDCGGEKTRLPDILDVWLDAGSASWNCLNFPQEEEDFKRLFPADFIMEGNDQIRGWFNLLMVASMVTMETIPFKACYMHGMINDAKGRKMSKSEGNYILPEEVYKQYGADTFRYYSTGGAQPALDLNYNFDDIKVKYRNLIILWNVHNFLIELCKNNKINPSKLKIEEKELSREEEYILSKTHSTIRTVTDKLEAFLMPDVPHAIEDLMLELSRSYIQLTRDKASIGTERQKEIVAHTTYTVLMESLKLFAVVTPFITEKIYLNFKDAFKLKTESIHLHKWPTFDETLIDEQLERDFSISSKVIQATLHAREKAQVGVRWPLSHIRVATTNDDVQASLERSKEIILQQTNVKELLIEETFRDAKTTVKADFKQLGPDFGNKAPLIVAALAKESSQSILEKLEKDKKFVVEVNGEKCNVVKEHLIVQREVPDNYIEADFGVGQLYLSTESNEALEGEGYAREVMRRIQSLRKDNGLVKTDRISLFLKVDEELETMLQEWNRQIVDKVGAKIMKISTNNPAKTHIVSSKEKVKNHSFEIYFDKV